MKYYYNKKLPRRIDNKILIGVIFGIVIFYNANSIIFWMIVWIGELVG